MQYRVVIDACCMLNLLATRREMLIVNALDLYLVESPQVSVEPLFLWTRPDDEGTQSKEPTSTIALREAGRLETRAIDTDVLQNAFIDAAARIKDTDATCIALAGVLRLPLFTDDRKERKIARDLFPQIELLSTLDILASAAQAMNWSTEQLAVVAQNLRWCGNFAPPKSDPRGTWYEELLGR